MLLNQTDVAADEELEIVIITIYRNDPKFLDRYAWANSADPDDQGLHCLPFHLHCLDSLGHHFLFFWFTKSADPNFSKTGIKIKRFISCINFCWKKESAPNVESVSLLSKYFNL